MSMPSNIWPMFIRTFNRYDVKNISTNIIAWILNQSPFHTVFVGQSCDVLDYARIALTFVLFCCRYIYGMLDFVVPIRIFGTVVVSNVGYICWPQWVISQTFFVSLFFFSQLPVLLPFIFYHTTYHHWWRPLSSFMLV